MIRPAAVYDLGRVLEVARDCFPAADRPTAAWLVRRLAAGPVLTVDDAGGGLVRGFLLAEPYPSGWRVRYVAVAPEFRRAGVGRRLLATVPAPASAYVRADNRASRALFAAAGYEIGHEPPGGRNWMYYHLPAGAR